MAKSQRIGTDDGERKVLAAIAEFGWHSMNGVVALTAPIVPSLVLKL
jgi:hypothetical protein